MVSEAMLESSSLALEHIDRFAQNSAELEFALQDRVALRHLGVDNSVVQNGPHAVSTRLLGLKGQVLMNNRCAVPRAGDRVFRW